MRQYKKLSAEFIAQKGLSEEFKSFRENCKKQRKKDERKLHYQKHKDEIKKHSREYYEAHKKEISEYNRSRRILLKPLTEVKSNLKLKKYSWLNHSTSFTER